MWKKNVFTLLWLRFAIVFKRFCLVKDKAVAPPSSLGQGIRFKTSIDIVLWSQQRPMKNLYNRKCYCKPQPSMRVGRWSKSDYEKKLLSFDCTEQS
jgi:hypothetical protein